jgi:hypothetical protein
MLSATRRRGFVLASLFPLLLLAACGESEPADLVQAAQVIQHMLQPEVIAQSTFAVAFQDPRPSQFVSFLFSEMGGLEWAATAKVTGASPPGVNGRLATAAGIVFVPRQPDPALGRQIVVSYDDDRGLIVVEGFEDPTGQAVLRREWVLPDVNPSPGVRALYQANQQAGMSCQAF